MANDYFSFKRFTIHQDRCAMKVGTDGVLLGVLAPTIDSGRILDIGTGTGLVGIMLSQRCPQAMVTGVEIDADAAKQAEENATSTGWKIKIINKKHPRTKHKHTLSQGCAPFSDTHGSTLDFTQDPL